MRIEVCIDKEKITKMSTGAVDALKEELTRRISKRYDGYRGDRKSRQRRWAFCYMYRR